MIDNLQKVFDFDNSELLLNQKGQFSQKQVNFLDKTEKQEKFSWRLGFVIIVLFLGTLSSIALYNIGFDFEKNKGPIIGYGAFFAIGLSIYLFFFVIGKLRSDLKSRKISVAEGIAELYDKKVGHGSLRAYFLKIDGVKFQLIDQKVYQIFKPYNKYRIFYIRHSGKHFILSVESYL